MRALNPAALCIAVLVIAPFWQAGFGVNGDASWIITMCERILAGDRLYVDLIETNPPFTIWMFMPAVLLARSTGISPEFMVHAYTYAACLLGFGLAAAIVRKANLAELPGLKAISPVILALLVLLPGNSFAEREHVGLALLLPLLALMAWRLDERSAPTAGWAIAAGLCGSIIVLVKPYYALMILVPALGIAWRKHSFRHLLSPEYWVIGIICIAYLIAVLTMHPEFMNSIYPLLRDTYMRTGDPLSVLGIYVSTAAIPAYLIYRFQRRLPWPPIMIVALLSAAGGFLPLVYQGKGWAYHAYPTLFLLLAALAYAAWHRASAKPEERLSTGGKALVLIAYVIAALPFLLIYKPSTDMIEAVRTNAPPNPSVALIGAGIEAGHPFTRLVNGRWIGAYCSDWLGGFAFVWGKIDEMEGRTDRFERYRQIYADYVAKRGDELVRANPDVVLLQKGDSIWTDPFLATPRMSGFLDRYELLAEDIGVQAYLLKPQHRSQ